MEARTKQGGRAENLIPTSQREPEERRALGAKGGKRSGEVRREKKTIRAALEALLAMDAPKEAASEAVEAFPELAAEKLTGAQALAVAAYRKALEGDTRAAVFIRDTVGEKPIEQSRIETEALAAPLEVIFVNPVKRTE